VLLLLLLSAAAVTAHVQQTMLQYRLQHQPLLLLPD
jgi:hypothetical protein